MRIPSETGHLARAQTTIPGLNAGDIHPIPGNRRVEFTNRNFGQEDLSSIPTAWKGFPQNLWNESGKRDLPQVPVGQSEVTVFVRVGVVGSRREWS